MYLVKLSPAALAFVRQATASYPVGIVGPADRHAAELALQVQREALHALDSAEMEA